MTKRGGENLLNLECESCGCKPDDADELNEVEGIQVCGECRIMCGRCESDVLIDNVMAVNDDAEVICDDCCDRHYTQCADCSKYALNDYMYYCEYPGAYSVCEDCFCDSYFSCEACERVVHWDNALSTDWATYCEDCYEQERQQDCGGINDWNYRPSPVFHGNTDDKLYMGIELEVEGGFDAIDPLLQQWGDTIYFKGDGSLSNGFELVTHPLSMEWIRINDLIEVAGQALRNNGAKSHNTSTCGIHVHLSRAAFKSAHLWKLIQFHYRNAQPIQVIAQRDSSWAKWTGSDDADYRKQASKYGESNSDRYVAVNLCNRETIELRYFKGNLRPDRIRKNIEFAHAVYAYTKQLTYPAIRKGNGLGFMAFVLWLAEHEAEYPNLGIFVTENMTEIRRACPGKFVKSRKPRPPRVVPEPIPPTATVHYTREQARWDILSGDWPDRVADWSTTAGYGAPWHPCSSRCDSCRAVINEMWNDIIIGAR